MQTNNLLFSIVYEWRSWAGQRGKLLLLLVGFALVCALLAITFRLASVLFYEHPSWVQQDGHYYTVANESPDGSQSGASRVLLESLKDVAGVEQVSWVSSRTVPLTSNDYLIPKPQALLYESELISMLGIAELATTTDMSGVWLTDRFWREAFKADPSIVGSYLQLERAPSGLVVRGVLPPRYNRVGNWSLDVWMSSDYAKYFTPFDVDNETMVNNFLDGIPMNFGIIRTSHAIDHIALAERTRQEDFVVPGMVFLNERLKLMVYEGINLNPIARQSLLQQWQLIILLVVGLGLVLSLNLVTVLTSRMIIYQQQYRIMQTLGATRMHFVRSAAISAFIHWLAIGIISLLGLSWFGSWVANFMGFQQVAGTAAFAINYLQWLSAWALVGALFACCLMVPLLQMSRGHLFSRSMSSSTNKRQRLLAQANLVAQFVVVLVALNLTLTMGEQQIRQYAATKIDTTVVTQQIQQRGDNLASQALLDAVWQGDNAANIAVSDSSFPSGLLVPYDQGPLAVLTTARLVYVTSNYFKVLGVASIAGSEDWEAGVSINRAAAELLAPNQHPQSILGRSFDLGFMFGTHPVVQVVENIPHQGRSNGDGPTIYLNIKKKGVVSDRFTFYYAGDQAGEIGGMLERWADAELVNAILSSPRTIAEILAKLDKRQRDLFFSSMFVALLVVFGVTMSLLYQVKARLFIDQHEYAVQLAMGAPFRSLLWQASKQFITALLVAIPFAWIIYLELVGQVTLSSGVSLLVLLILALVATLRPLLALLKRPIFSLLRQN